MTEAETISALNEVMQGDHGMANEIVSDFIAITYPDLYIAWSEAVWRSLEL